MKRIDLIRLKLYLLLHNYLYKRIGSFASKINNGIHPKHKIMNYHKFFLDNIDEGSKVLDIGCGNGVLTYNIAKKAQKVVACDINKNSIEYAKRNFLRENIRYLIADVTTYNFEESFDYVILSNLLEHIKNRVDFLKKIKLITKFLLIRVPMINRSWLPLYKKEMGLEYRLDSSHYIEYTIDSFKDEITSTGLRIISYTIQFGEIWARLDTVKS